MAQDSKIEWTHHTANLWHGCTKVHEGCDNCYAETLSKRWGNDIWGNDKPRKEIKSVWNDLVKYQKLAAQANEVHRVFVGSMMDIFEKPMPLVDSKGNEPTFINGYGEDVALNTGDLRENLFDAIDKDMFPNLQFLLLTKRPSNINKYIPEGWKTNPPKNVMFGTSPVNQETANKLIPQLLQVNGKRFLSVEPQLDLIDLTQLVMADSKERFDETFDCLTGFWINKLTTGIAANKKIDWVIQGGESGHHRRPFNLDWAYYMKQQCEAANVPYFFKQIDKVLPIPEDLLNRRFPTN
ncbi:MAG TPA: DUF5131 family protein [Segetibacter sp.]|jgi:protein gp37